MWRSLVFCNAVVMAFGSLHCSSTVQKRSNNWCGTGALLAKQSAMAKKTVAPPKPIPWHRGDEIAFIGIIGDSARCVSWAVEQVSADQLTLMSLDRNIPNATKLSFHATWDRVELTSATIHEQDGTETEYPFQHCPLRGFSSKDRVKEHEAYIAIGDVRWFRSRAACEEALAKKLPVAVEFTCDTTLQTLLYSSVMTASETQKKKALATFKRTLTKGGRVYVVTESEEDESIRCTTWNVTPTSSSTGIFSRTSKRHIVEYDYRWQPRLPAHDRDDPTNQLSLDLMGPGVSDLKEENGRGYGCLEVKRVTVRDGNSVDVSGSPAYLSFAACERVRRRNIMRRKLEQTWLPKEPVEEPSSQPASDAVPDIKNSTTIDDSLELEPADNLFGGC